MTATMELVETGEKRDRLGRKITPAPRREELVAAWRESGLTQAEFARREGVRYPTFATWVQQRRPTRVQPRSPAPKVRAAGGIKFAEVPWPALVGAPALEVQLADGTRVRGTSAREVAAVARALRS